MESAVRKKKRSSAHASSCKISAKVPGEDCVCFVCHDGGTLIMCDRRQCPKAYHPECVGRNLAFFKTKGAWLCARHFCSKCWKQPCTYCVMCPNSFCPKCLSSMPTEVFLPLSETAGLCEACMRLVKMIELQHTIDTMAVNFEDSETFEFLFKEYWLLLKGFHGFNLANLAPSDAAPPQSCSSDNVNRDDMPSMNLERINDHQRPNYKAMAPLQTTVVEPSPTQETTISVPSNIQALIKRRSTDNDSNSPAKKKVRVLKLLNDSSSDDGDKPLSSMIHVGKQEANKLLPEDKTFSAEITVPSLFAKALEDLGKPLPVSNFSSPSKNLLVIDDSCQALGVNTSPPLLFPLMEPLQISLPPLQADACKSPADRNLCKRARSSEVSSKNKRENLKLANDALTSAKKLPGSTKRALPTALVSAKKSLGTIKMTSPTALVSAKKSRGSRKMASPHRPESALASTSKPLPIAVRTSTLSAAKASPNLSIVSCKPLLIKTDSFKTPVSEPLQLYRDISGDKPSNNAASDCEGPSLKANTVLPTKRLHGRSIAQESCNTVDAASSTYSNEETLAPINVQNVNLIYLRRSNMEELLSEERFTLLVLGAFVRIRNSKEGNNYRLVQIAGTTLQTKLYQAGEKKTNVVLEVLNLNRRQRIRIDHVSNNMFTEEECQRLQQSVELGFIKAPTIRALSEKAVVLRKAKGNKCLDEKPAKLPGEVQPRESGLVDNGLRKSLDEVSKIRASPHQSVKPHTGTRVDGGKQVEAEQGSASLELATTIAAQVALEKQVDADQHSDISVEMATVSADKGESKMHSSENLAPLVGQTCPEHEAELTLAEAIQQTSLMAGVKNQALGDGTIEAHSETQVSVSKKVDTSQQYDISSDLATNNTGKAEDKMYGANISSTSAARRGTQEDEVALNLSQGKLQAESQGYGTNTHPTERHDTGITYQLKNQAKGDGCGKEYIPAVVAIDSSDKGAMDSMQWFYQDMKKRTFGPFSLRQLKKWNSTGVFPPDLEIWRKVAGQRSFIFLTAALKAQEMEVPFGMGTEKCAAEKSCSGDWTSQKENGKLNLVTSPKSAQVNMKDTSGKRCPIETPSNWKDPVTNSKFEKALNAPISINIDSFREFHILEKETFCEGERKFSPAHTLAKEAAAEEEREGMSSLAHTLAKETSVEGETEGQRSLACIEGTDQMLETLVTLDDGWDFPGTGKLDLGFLWTTLQSTQFDILEEKLPPVKTLQCGKSNTLVIDKECKMAMRLEESSDRKQDGKCISVHTEQRKETHAAMDDGWDLAETEEFESETLWATQFDALNKEAEVIRCRDEELSNLINAVTTREYKDDMNAPTEIGETHAESGWQCLTMSEETSAHGNKKSCNTEQNMERLVALDNGWTHTDKDQRWAHSSQGHASTWRVEDADCNGSRRGRDTCAFDRSRPQRDNSHSKSLQVQASNWRRNHAGEGIEREPKRSSAKESTMRRENNESRRDHRSPSSERNSPKNSEKRTAKEFMRSHSSELHKQDRCRSDQKSFPKEQEVFPRNSGTEREEEARRSHSRNGWKSISMEQKASPEYAGKRTEEVRRTHSRNDQRCISREPKASPESAGIRTEKEFRRSHSRNNQRSNSRARKVSSESAGERTEKEVRRSYSRNDGRSISRKEKAFPEISGKDEVKGSHSRGERGSISREQKASPESAGERAQKKVKTFHSRHDRRSISEEPKLSLESAGRTEIQRSHSKIDQRSISREQEAFSESAGRRTEQEVRRFHSRNGRRSISRERKASPETAGKMTENEVRRSHLRRSKSRGRKASSKSAGRRIEEEVWKCQSRDTMRPLPREQMPSPSSSTHRSFSSSVDEALRSRPFSRERRHFSTHGRSSVHKSFLRILDDDHLGSFKDQRSRYADNAAEKSSVREKRTSPCKRKIQPSSHILCPNESTLQQPQSGERGWTPPESPLNFAPRCVSLSVAEVERSDDPRPLSGMLRFESPSSPQEFLRHPGSPELIARERYTELPPPPPLVVSPAPNYTKLPSPPPLPAETSTLCHIDHYATCTIVN